MLLSPVQSSNVKAIGYDPITSQLRVEFNNGGVYNYEDVPAETYRGLMASHSKGAFLAANIKGKHAHSKHDPEA